MFALCFFVCILLLCLCFAFFVCVFYFFACVVLFCVRFLFLFGDVFFFCLRFLYFFDDVFFFVCVFFFCLSVSRFRNFTIGSHQTIEATSEYFRQEKFADRQNKINSRLAKKFSTKKRILDYPENSRPTKKNSRPTKKFLER